jgi:hypothetical protein
LGFIRHKLFLHGGRILTGRKSLQDWELVVLPHFSFWFRKKKEERKREGKKERKKCPHCKPSMLSSLIDRSASPQFQTQAQRTLGAMCA